MGIFGGGDIILPVTGFKIPSDGCSVYEGEILKPLHLKGGERGFLENDTERKKPFLKVKYYVILFM